MANVVKKHSTASELAQKMADAAVAKAGEHCQPQRGSDSGRPQSREDR
jgi:hypothetical protein